MTFDAALHFANDLYLRNRRDFEPVRLSVSDADPKKVERNRRQAFYDHLHAERRWASRNR
jgi:hypothetical protein